MLPKTITLNQQIRDGETIISAHGRFELGFFSPGISKNRYLGIRYKKVAAGTVAWVANRQLPITDSSGVLKITDQGNLILLNGTNFTIWSSNSSRSAHNPNAQILESGNLVIRNGNDSDPENFLWQSFDHPGSTLLPGMKIGKNRITSLDLYLASWKSTDDPSRGNFTYLLDPSGFPQPVLMQGSDVIFRSGPWNGLRFSGSPEMMQDAFASSSKRMKQSWIISLSVTIVALVLLSLLLTLYILKKKKKKKIKRNGNVALKTNKPKWVLDD